MPDRDTSNTNTVEIREVSIQSDDARSLIALLDRELQGEYLPDEMHTVDFDSFHRAGGIFVVAYDNHVPVACGALRPFSLEEVELKRMFVVSSHRGSGIGRVVLHFLERKASESGFRRLLLETGDAQKAAMRLYKASGFHRIQPFGGYINSSRSICFAKDL